MNSQSPPRSFEIFPICSQLAPCCLRLVSSLFCPFLIHWMIPNLPRSNGCNNDVLNEKKKASLLLLQEGVKSGNCSISWENKSPRLSLDDLDDGLDTCPLARGFLVSSVVRSVGRIIVIHVQISRKWLPDIGWALLPNRFTKGMIRQPGSLPMYIGNSGSIPDHPSLGHKN